MKGVMESSDEMYRLGVQDAEQGSLNLFYYQHYYYYRQGYDRSRRLQQNALLLKTLSSRRLLFFFAVVLVLAAVLGGVGVLVSQDSEASMVPTSIAGLPLEHRVVEKVSPSPLPPTATPLPPTLTPAVPTLHTGGMAEVVNVGEAALLVRNEPGLHAAVQVRLTEGTRVTILEGPVDADSYRWWRIESEHGAGWSAERRSDGTPWLRPMRSPSPVPPPEAEPDEPAAPDEPSLLPTPDTLPLESREGGEFGSQRASPTAHHH
jgi:hypothetical protein